MSIAKFGSIAKKIKPIIRKKPVVCTVDPNAQSELERVYYKHPDFDQNLLHIYTDGSAYNNGKANATGGYGVFYATGDIPNVSERIKAGKITNNVAELRAIIVALKQIKSCKRSACIHYDSEYAAGVITGKTQAHKNLELVKEGKDLYRDVLDYVTFKHIPAEHIKIHTVDHNIHTIGNDIADHLAKGLKNF